MPSVSDLTVALEAARAGAAEVSRSAHLPTQVRFKGEADPVTAVDHRSEQAVFDVIGRRRPSDPVVGEEREGHLPEAGRVWLVDPLDGTTNFIHGFPWFSVSVALWVDDAPAVGVVVNVTTGDEYTAVAGGGARVNGARIGVSVVRDLGEAIIVTGFPYRRSARLGICDTRFRSVLEAAQGIRRLGSAALDMCMVAAGKMDGYWEEDLSPWDMGAGVLLVMEAGGAVTSRSGRPIGASQPFVVASNGWIHRRFLATLNGETPSRVDAGR